MSFIPTPYSAAGPQPMASPAPQPINPRLLLLHQFMNQGGPIGPPSHAPHIQMVQDIHEAARNLAQQIAATRGPQANRALRPDTQQNGRNLPIARPESQSSMAAHAAALQMALQMAHGQGGNPFHFPQDPGIYQIPNAHVGGPVPPPNFAY